VVNPGLDIENTGKKDAGLIGQRQFFYIEMVLLKIIVQ